LARRNFIYAGDADKAIHDYSCSVLSVKITSGG
jgi:hypothetical protein